MNDEALFEHYKNIATVLGKMFAPLLEVVVHDLRTPECSIIHIENSNITGRKIGDPTTELGRRRIDDKMVPDMLVGYPNESPRGSALKSSSLAIRNEKGKVIGAFCLNLEIEGLQQIVSSLSLFTTTESSSAISPKEEFNHRTTKDEIKADILHYREQHGGVVAPLSVEDKKALVSYLEQKGHLRKRGAVTIIAEYLKVTRATVYNYINEEVRDGNA